MSVGVLLLRPFGDPLRTGTVGSRSQGKDPLRRGSLLELAQEREKLGEVGWSPAVPNEFDRLRGPETLHRSCLRRRTVRRRPIRDISSSALDTFGPVVFHGF